VTSPLPPAPGRLTAAGAAALDVAAVVAFVLVGRRSHAEGVTVAGVAGTAWPFLVGLALGWVGARGWRAPAAWRTGVVAWAAAVGVGLALRAAATGGPPPVSFAVVTAVVLGGLLAGWRALARVAAARAAGSRGVPAWRGVPASRGAGGRGAG